MNGGGITLARSLFVPVTVNSVTPLRDAPFEPNTSITTGAPVLITAPSPSHVTIARALRRMLAKLYRPDLRPAARVRPNPTDSSPPVCPSSSAEFATAKLADLDSNGKAVFVAGPIRRQPAGGRPTDRSSAHSGSERWTGACKQDRCEQWNGFCRLGVAAALAASELPGVRPAEGCPITETCRWRLENGPSACVLCPWINRLDPLALISIHEGASN